MYVLDVTRTIERGINAHPTGIDRVERAYIDYFKLRGDVIFCYVKNNMLWRLSSTDLDVFLAGGACPLESDQSELSKDLVEEFVFVNVSHHGVNESHPVLYIGGKRSYVFFLHDLIPIQNPEYVRPGDAETHEKRIILMAALASLIICNSYYTKSSLECWARDRGVSLPKLAVAQLATDIHKLEHVRPDLVVFDNTDPFFLYISTIEPRKNHVTLLHAWIRIKKVLGPKTPKLVLVGKRGWNNEDTFRFLDTNVALKSCVSELGSVSDAMLRRLLHRCAAVLFPSINEGWGIPITEARHFRKKIICSDIPAFREAAGETAIFVDPLSVKDWVEEVLEILSDTKQIKMSEPPKFTWVDHFKIIDAELAVIKNEY